MNRTKLNPKDVLWNYDGPIMFSANFHSQLLLFIMIDEDEENSTRKFLASVVDENIINLVKNCKLSVRGAMIIKPRYFVELQGLEVAKYSYVNVSDLTEEILPDSGVALLPEYGFVPDSI